MSLKINHYLEILNNQLKDEKDNFFYAYRGQPSKEYELNCTASRPPFENKTLSTVSLKENQKNFLMTLE